MRAKNDELIRDIAKLLNYDSATGNFSWAVGKTKGEPVGFVKSSDGRVYLTHKKLHPLAHRVAWFMHYGEIPSADLDHINGIKTDNRIANLRLATEAQNNRNRPKQSNNTTGFKGVTFHKRQNKFHANITADKQRHNLGYFSTPEAAHEAYMQAARRLHGDFAKY